MSKFATDMKRMTKNRVGYAHVRQWVLALFFLLTGAGAEAQPAPCGPVPTENQLRPVFHTYSRYL